MAVVTVFGTAWDHAAKVIPAVKRPELWFRPNQSNVRVGALLAGVEVKATLTVSTGAFTVGLDNTADCRYRPILRWVNNPSEPDPELWSWGYLEWPFEFWPGANGGEIGTLINAGGNSPLAYYFGPLSDPPPPGFRGEWEVQAEPGREDSDDPFIGDVRRVYGG
ncbi:MAG: hypothetical protein LBE05_05685 [Microbacterium sp.]|nr:hypothetical protein [Microbacterium sp.]